MEQVVTAGLRRLNQTNQNFRDLMGELGRLVETAGGTVLQEFTQTRPHPEPGTLFGVGKLKELAEAAERLGVKTVVFDDDLSPGQQKNIEKIIPAKIVDRTRLILDIFAQRARTREGQLQVELAQLNYLVPRLTGAWRGFSQQMGGIGTRGPGERKIEVERRYVRDRIKRLKKDIEDLRQHRSRVRLSREEIPLPQVALVGYTNVGKSTLLNKLMGDKDQIYADDKLFATLDPTTRRIKLPGGRMILMTDTVGFIQKLPHYLVAAFHATLEEVTRSTFLIHLVDPTASNSSEQVKNVNEVIKTLDADQIPMLTVTTKSDLLSPELKNSYRKKGSIFVSSKTGEGLKELLGELEQTLDEWLVDVTFELPYSERQILSEIYRTGYIVSEKATPTGAKIHVRVAPNTWKKISGQLKNGVKSTHES